MWKFVLPAFMTMSQDIRRRYIEEFRGKRLEDITQAGVDIYRVSKFLGHSSVTVTEKHYVDLLKKDHMDMSNILGNIINSDTQMIRTNNTKPDQFSADLATSDKSIKTRKLELLRREISCGSGQNRTADTGIFSPLLYRLSYRATAKKRCNLGYSN